MRRWTLASLLVGRAALADPADEVIEVHDRAPDAVRPDGYDVGADDLRHLPGANNDALRAVEAMPGVAHVPFSFGALVLRGASPRDSSVYLDGIEVPIAFHFGGVTSFIPSQQLADVRLIPGGFDASFGRAQGGLVTMTSREPRRDAWQATGELGVMQSAASAEGPLAGGGIGVGVRRSYLDQVAGPFVGDATPLPSYWDAQLRGSWGDARDGGRWSPIVVTAFDHITSERLGLEASSGFVRAGLPYLRQWNATTLHVVPWLGWTDIGYTYKGTLFEPEGVPQGTVSRTSYPGGLRADVTRDTDWGELRAGIDTEATYAAKLLRMGERVGAATTWIDASVWTDARIAVGDRVSIRTGVRAERYGLTRETVIDPRLELHVRATDVIVARAAAGRYHQPPTVADVDPQDGNPALRASYTDQVSLGIGAELAGITALLTAYDSRGHLLGVPVPDPVITERPTPIDFGGFGPTMQQLLDKDLGTALYRGNVGRSHDYGIELGMRGRVGRWFGLASYTLSWARRSDDPMATPGWRPYELDQRHKLELATTVQLGRWSLGARLAVVSGTPYSPMWFDPQRGLVIEPWAATLPTYVDLDVRADRRWEPGWGTIDAYVELQNATDHHNVEGMLFMNGQQIPQRGLPLIPFAGVSISL